MNLKNIFDESKMNNILDELLGKNNWSAHCISLENSLDRREKFQEWASFIELDFQFFNAVDKNTLSKDEIFVVVDKVSKQYMSSGATACRLSHLKLCKYLLENTDHDFFFILEDDAGFSKQFDKNGIKSDLIFYLSQTKDIEWDIVWFGYPENGGLKNLIQLDMTPNIVKVKHSHQSHAFIVTREILKFLVVLYEDKTKHYRLAVDWILDIVLSHVNCVGPPFSIISQVDSEESFIEDDIDDSGTVFRSEKEYIKYNLEDFYEYKDVVEKFKNLRS
jgi:GR25 family glycosyltransferase involved in LPS biosynthesis